MPPSQILRTCGLRRPCTSTLLLPTQLPKIGLATAGYLETQPQIGSLNQIQWFLKHYKFDWLMTASGIKKERRRIELVSHSDELSFALVNFWSHHMRASSHDESWKPSLCRPHWVESLFGIKFTYSKYSGLGYFFCYAKGLAILVCLSRAGRAEQYPTKIPDNLLLAHFLRIQIPYVKI